MKKIFLINLFFYISLASSHAQSVQEARRLTENEQYETATNMFKTLLASKPADASLFYYYGINLLLNGNADSANIIFQKGKTIDPANPFIKIGEAKILLDNINLNEAKAASEKDGANPELRIRHEKAIENLKTANALIDEVTLNTKDINVLIESAKALVFYENKDTDKAKLLLNRATLIEPKNIEVLLLYGDIYTELNNGTLAAEYYNQALDLNKASARAIVSKGRLYKRSTNYEGAAREFENAISLEPSYAPAHRELGEAYIKLGKLSQAKEEYKKYIELSKNNCGARIRYATFLYVSKNYSEALAELDQVQDRCDSNNITMLRIQSYCYYETKDTTRGLASINHLFRLLPSEKRSSRDFEYYGKLLIATDKDSIGIEQLQKALALEPTRADLLSDMANAWIKLKQYPNAISLLNQKISNGKDVKVLDRFTLARAYYFNKLFVEADSAATKVNELSPNYGSGWLLRAQANAHIDSTSEGGLAKPHYERYIEIAQADSANPAKYQNGLIEAYGYLAYYYILKKDNANGIIFLKKKLELPLEVEDKKNVQKAVDQLEGRGPKPKQ